MPDKLPFEESYDYIRRQWSQPVGVGIVLGTGLARLAQEIDVQLELAYNFIPHFPISTVESHFGKLIFGTMGNQLVVAMQGRFHYYEGYSMQQITLPIRVMKLLGVHTLFISNAAGGLNPAYRKGDLCVIEDHINLQPENPLRGPNLDKLGPRFPDMSQPYNAQLASRALAIAAQEAIAAHKGVYAAVAGPNLETRAEYRMLQRLGADLVGMSTVPEVIVANHMGMRTFAMSVVTDECDPENLQPVTVEEIISVAATAEPKLTRILHRLILELEPTPAA